MRPHKLAALAVVSAALTCLICTWTAAGEPDASIAALITQAGNAQEDAVRLKILKKLQKTPGLDVELKADVDNLVVEVDRWVSFSRMTYFGRQVSRTMDYDFKISQDSPLYPITCLYRGRMLVWITLESGNIIRYEDRRRKFLDKAVENFKIAAAAFPENRIIRMYLGEPIPCEKQYTAPQNAPQWAALERENLERLTEIIVWWIGNRMQPNGEYGGGWGDDCEMWRWWAPVLIGFDDPKITDAQARFSQALMSQEHMKHGYTTRMTDVEHTAEDSSDVITPMMHLEPLDPVWNRRAGRLAELMENLWTGINQRGFLQFKSTYFTVDKVNDDPQKACDTVYHPRAVQPALLFWQRTGNQKLGRLFSAWMDTWVDAAARAERGKPAGIVPSAIHWPDGRVGGLSDDWWDPRNHGEPTLYAWPSALPMLNDTLLLTYHMTGDQKYLQPLRSMAAIRLKYLKQRPEKPPAAGTEAWCAGQLGLLGNTLAKYKGLTGSTEFDELLARDYGGWITLGLAGDRASLVARLQDSAEALRINFQGYTSEVRWTDRVLRFPALFEENMMFPEAIPGINRPNPSLLYSITTGDPGDCGYFPMNAVRWLTPPRQIAAMVTGSGIDHFSAELFHFGHEPRPMSAELYLLEPGRYTFSLTAKQNSADRSCKILRRLVEVEGPVTRVALELPPQQLILMRLQPAAQD